MLQRPPCGGDGSLVMTTKLTAEPGAVQQILDSICPKDLSQAAVIRSNEPRMFVTAPSGYGKTATMTGKIVYELATGIVPNPKRILALTFSVSAARKMRNQVYSALEDARIKLGADCTNRIHVNNYHGFARNLLSLYGKLVGLEPSLLKTLKTCDENGLLEALQETGVGIASEAVHALTSFDKQIKGCDRNGFAKALPAYNAAIREYAIANGFLTYNSLITLAIQLLAEQKGLHAYLQNTYTTIMVDEAQDTNVLHLELLSCLIADTTRCSFFGDPLQRIYGFLGALPNFKEVAKGLFVLQECALANNHRFESNAELLQLDRCLRGLMDGELRQESARHASLPVVVARTYDGQIAQAHGCVTRIMNEHEEARIAVLFNRRCDLSRQVCSSLESNGIEFFDALFNDDSTEYVTMCNRCLGTLNSALAHEAELTSAEAKDILAKLSDAVSRQNYDFGKSYSMLLRALAGRIDEECSGMDGYDRYHYVASILSTHSLRRYSEFVKTKLTISTIHSAKGLEWDYVIVPGVTKWDFTIASCGSCSQKNGGGLQLSGIRVCKFCNSKLTQKMRDQLNIWYVAMTRAKRKVIVISAYERITKSGNYQECPASCLLGLPGIEAIAITEV